MSMKHKNVCGILNYIEQLLILFAKVAGYVYIFAFASSVGIPVGITSSAIGLTNVQQLQLLKSIRQYFKRKRSMMK